MTPLPPLAARIRSLTPRQAEAVAYTWHGYTIDQIAAAMGCSWDTAKIHLHAAYTRLGLGEASDRTCAHPRVLAAVALYRAVQLATTNGTHERMVP